MRYTAHRLVIAVVLGLVFLGAGCAKQPPPPASDGGLKPAATAPAPADPLADDLDTAIEELKMIDGATE